MICSFCRGYGDLPFEKGGGSGAWEYVLCPDCQGTGFDSGVKRRPAPLLGAAERAMEAAIHSIEKGDRDGQEGRD